MVTRLTSAVTHICQLAGHDHPRCKALQVTEADGTITRTRRHAPNWLTFAGFLEDMGERPPGTTLTD